MVRSSRCRVVVSVLLALGLGLALTIGCGKSGDGSCASADDCKKDGLGAACVNGKCLGCAVKTDCDSGKICVQNECKSGCAQDTDCETISKKHQCVMGVCVVKCSSHDECAADEYCSNRVCKKGQRPNENKAGKYQPCSRDPKSENPPPCLDGLTCATYKGGTVNRCWKPCSEGCDDKTEVCVKEADFAEGYSVCMKKVTDESAGYNYDEGKTCDEGLIRLTHGNVNEGSCWKDCTAKCLGDRKCLKHPRVTSGDTKFCFKPCTADTECPKGSKCREHPDDASSFYCYL